MLVDNCVFKYYSSYVLAVRAMDTSFQYRRKLGVQMNEQSKESKFFQQLKTSKIISYLFSKDERRCLSRQKDVKRMNFRLFDIQNWLSLNVQCSAVPNRTAPHQQRNKSDTAALFTWRSEITWYWNNASQKDTFHVSVQPPNFLSPACTECPSSTIKALLIKMPTAKRRKRSRNQALELN